MRNTRLTYPAPFATNNPADQTADRERVRDVVEQVSGFEVTTPGRLPTPLRASYRILTPGSYVLPEITRGMRISAVPGCLVPASSTVNITTDEPVVVEGFDFAAPVTLGATARCIFRNCIFRDVVAMAAGATAHYIGSQFVDEGTVTNAGVATNAYVIGVIRTSGVAYTNVTVISETV